MHVRKNDLVAVISGSEKGKQGKVLEILEGRNGYRVRIEKLQIVKRHTKPGEGNRSGGIKEMEASIAISNVLPVCPKEDKPRRVKTKVVGDKKTRVCVKCGEEIVASA